jgi:hypothetical protein
MMGSIEIKGNWKKRLRLRSSRGSMPRMVSGWSSGRYIIGYCEDSMNETQDASDGENVMIR